MGSGVSRSKSKRVELQKLQSDDNASNLQDVNNCLTEQENTSALRDMDSSSVVQNQPGVKTMLSDIENTIDVLKTHLSDETLASKDAVSRCVEILKFSCFLDENEEIKTAAVDFLLEKHIPGLIFEIYGALLAKYPDVTKYDREKVEVSE